MTPIEVLINNVYQIGFRAGGGILALWGLYIFFKTIFGEGGRNPVRIVGAVLVIIAGGAIFQLLPHLVDIGKQTGGVMSGGAGGYSMPAPARISDRAQSDVVVLS